MKKLAVLFVFLYVFTNTELHELIKLPSMFMHYKEHLEHDGPIGFSNFIHIHYTSDHPHQDNDEDTEEMPFQDHHSLFALVAATKELNSYNIKIEVNNPQTINISIPNEDFDSSSFIDQIWQPPRSC